MRLKIGQEENQTYSSRHVQGRVLSTPASIPTTKQPTKELTPRFAAPLLSDVLTSAVASLKYLFTFFLPNIPPIFLLLIHIKQ